MVKNYTYTLNEGFTNYFKKLEESKGNKPVSIIDYYNEDPSFERLKTLVSKTVKANKNLFYDYLDLYEEDDFDTKEVFQELLDAGLYVKGDSIMIPKGFTANIAYVEDDAGWNPFMVLQTSDGKEVFYDLDVEGDKNNLKSFIIQDEIEESVKNESLEDLKDYPGAKKIDTIKGIAVDTDRVQSEEAEDKYGFYQGDIIFGDEQLEVGEEYTIDVYEIPEEDWDEEGTGFGIGEDNPYYMVLKK